MQLHQLRPTHKNKTKKRVGRGGKRGTYSGKGQKGQKSRSGHRTRPAERDMILRLPKLRGFKFKPLKPKPAIINIGDFADKIKDDTINRDILLQAGLIRKSQRRVKVLGSGEINRPITVQGLEISDKAKHKIEAAGGRIIH